MIVIHTHLLTPISFLSNFGINFNIGKYVPLYCRHHIILKVIISV